MTARLAGEMGAPHTPTDTNMPLPNKPVRVTWCVPQTRPSAINGDGVLFSLDVFPFLFP